MKLFFLAIACFSIFSCIKPSHESSLLTVPYHECARADGGGNRPLLCYESLNDFRCPANAICIWAGDAVARFRFTAHTQHEVTLSISGQMGISNDTTVEGHYLRLVELRPFPGTGAADTVAVVEVR